MSLTTHPTWRHSGQKCSYSFLSCDRRLLSCFGRWYLYNKLQ